MGRKLRLQYSLVENVVYAGQQQIDCKPATRQTICQLHSQSKGLSEDGKPDGNLNIQVLGAQTPKVKKKWSGQMRTPRHNGKASAVVTRSTIRRSTLTSTGVGERTREHTWGPSNKAISYWSNFRLWSGSVLHISYWILSQNLTSLTLCIAQGKSACWE